MRRPPVRWMEESVSVSLWFTAARVCKMCPTYVCHILVGRNVGICTSCKRVVSASLAARAAGRRAVRCSITRGLCRSVYPLIGRCLSRDRRPCRPEPRRRPVVVLDLSPRLVRWRGVWWRSRFVQPALETKPLRSNIYTRLCSVCGRLALADRWRILSFYTYSTSKFKRSIWIVRPLISNFDNQPPNISTIDVEVRGRFVLADRHPLPHQ